MNRIMFIDNSTNHDVYVPIEHWEPLLTFPVDVFHACSNGGLPDPEPYSHIIISGSEASVLGNDSWILDEEEFVRNAVKQGKAILGNCFGHQIIAKALFGPDKVQKRKIPEVGWHDVNVIQDDILLGESGRNLNGFIMHFDEVCNLPEEYVDVIASSSECETLAFKLKDKPVWGIQPHFEIGIVQGFFYINLLKEPGVPNRSFFINSDDKAPKDTGIIVQIVREFEKVQP